ncbi:MAG: fatty acid cis/trans isomerase [Marinomonas sp.]
MPRVLVIILSILFITGCAAFASHSLNEMYGVEKVSNRVETAKATVSDQDADFYNEKVRPILDHRCISCHACYDAPCQLKLTGSEGIERGGSKELVYDGSRLLAQKPTRLYIDAHSPEGWREKGFHPVLNERVQSPAANLDGSLIYRAIALREKQGDVNKAVLSDDYDFTLARDQQCPTIDEYRSFEKKYPKWGMPYGLPALTSDEFNTLSIWLAKGGKMPKEAPLSDKMLKLVDLWETRFNPTDLKSQVITRYIFEHIYLYSLYLGEGNEERFRLVRSRTPPGQPIDRIATRRPYDDPGVKKVYYRLWHDPEVVVQKNNIVYQLDETVYKRWHSYFYSKDYKITRDPGYDPEVATNPFRAFQEIPSEARYRFMLDHAENTIMSYIKGPVCRGPVAVNVINDHFWVYFINPDVSYNKEVAGFLESQVQHLDLPAENSSNALPLTSWLRFSNQQKKYLTGKAHFVEKALKDNLPLNTSLIWNGDGVNDNAALTIFRHFDNATVVKGLIGQKPKTSWVIDYPLLERIHYLLVAGFDVYGNVGHQLDTRLYMDFLRMEGEMNFILFLPKAEREKVRQYWYRDASQSIKNYIFSDFMKIDVQTNIYYDSNNYQSELYDRFHKHLEKVLDHSRDLDQSRLTKKEIAELAHLETLTGGGIRYLPDTALVLVTKNGKPKEIVSLIHNKGHTNISSLFDEAEARTPEEDTLTLVKGVLGDYPNALMSVDENQLKAFAEDIASMATEKDYSDFMARFGVRRTNPRFWSVSDSIAKLNKEARPRESGILDYNRLENR